jgi:predicted transcriptional regulator
MIGTMIWVKILANIEQNNISKISYKLNVTYSHISKVINEFEKRKWVIKKKVNGREIRPVLTKEGLKVQEICLKMLQITKEETVIR